MHTNPVLLDTTPLPTFRWSASYPYSRYSKPLNLNQCSWTHFPFASLGGSPTSTLDNTVGARGMSHDCGREASHGC